MRKKIIILIACIGVFLILLGICFAMRLEKHVGIIQAINDDTIQFGIPASQTDTEKEFIKQYMFSVKDVHILDSKGNSITIQDLKVGDTISVINNRPFKQTDIGYSVEPLKNVTVVRKLEE